MKCDKEVVLAAVKQDGEALKYANDSVKQDTLIVMVASLSYGDAKKYLKDEKCWSEKDLVMSAVQIKGDALQHASDSLKEDREVVKAAVSNNGSAVKFSLAEQSTPYATNFALAMKEDPFLGQFKTYNPNAWCKRSCDPDFTNIQHPCRGTSATCQFHESQNLTADTKKPCATSCWRFAFRFHQEESKVTGGFMIQVQERGGLGAGQKIETEMAEQAGLKVFRAKQVFNFDDGNNNVLVGGRKSIEVVSGKVEAWYEQGCKNMALEEFKLE